MVGLGSIKARPTTHAVDTRCGVERPCWQALSPWGKAFSTHFHIRNTAFTLSAGTVWAYKRMMPSSHLDRLGEASKKWL
jgi:hypothetical protein